MKWLSFFRPVRTLTTDGARAFMQGHDEGTYTLLDVRQPGEYEKAHIPGATLIPLPDLSERLEELDREKPLVAYCAVGGRSRAAAQYLSGQGFKDVYNLKGGMKGWDGLEAEGPEEDGMEYVQGGESLTDILVLAYGMEEGLGDFYRRLASERRGAGVRSLFERLAGIEDRHKDRVFERYRSLVENPIPREKFEFDVVFEAMEGGYTTEGFLARFGGAMEDDVGVLSTAMMLEAQAMDLYSRYARRSEDAKTRDALFQIAEEEKHHMASLGRLLEDAQRG